ncbi:hypothetical protein MHLP_03905 [Candidatus Mycoplasma haematolamae str. Purdue]|uniref:Uncharacterized protein n=1 Tax=Mycoplasma haematolamae (strain Purdue) TaxID=1212765 RepID=I7CGG7_MYCHA|nr:hypothetical protein [Candidatus Mycoplasma haematolamae]AFO52361.1 hypothetical protein MHLP_03905 [Candidatus Mycoplasma haematolamae str. Purdue]
MVLSSAGKIVLSVLGASSVVGCGGSYLVLDQTGFFEKQGQGVNYLEDFQPTHNVDISSVGKKANFKFKIDDKEHDLECKSLEDQYAIPTFEWFHKDTQTVWRLVCSYDRQQKFAKPYALEGKGYGNPSFSCTFQEQTDGGEEKINKYICTSGTPRVEGIFTEDTSGNYILLRPKT